jgi:hypothetical protein
MMTVELATIKCSALTLMTMALMMFDNIGETDAAVHLQHAIEVAEGRMPLQPGENLPPNSRAQPSVLVSR